MDIKRTTNGMGNVSLSADSFTGSPEASFHSSYSQSPNHHRRRGTNTNAPPAKQLKPFVSGDIKILLLENVNTAAQQTLKDQGYQVEALKSALPEAELIEKIRYVSHLNLLKPLTPPN